MKIKTAFFILLASILVLGSSGCGLVKNALGIGDEGALGELVGEVIEGIGESDPESEPEPAAPATPEPQSPADAPEPDPEPEEPGESEDQSVDMAGLTALEQLDSYRSQYVQSNTMDGEVVESWSITHEYTRDPMGRHTVSESTEGGEFEFIQLADVVYMLSDGEWMSYTSDDMDQSAFFAEPTGMGPEDLYNCRSQGTETVNGYPSTHYVCNADEDLAGWIAVSGGAIEDYRAETWVSEEHNIVIRSLIAYRLKEDDEVTDFRFETNVDRINEPLAIEAPEGVDPPGVSADIPVMDGATDQMSIAGMTTYSVSGQTVEDAVAWYKSEMAARGWTLDEEQSMDEAMMFAKDGQTYVVMVAADDDGVMVTILPNDQ